MSGSKEVNEAVGATEHDAEIAQLERELNQPSEREQKAQRLAALEAERAAKRQAQHVAVAEKRRIGIARALGSIRDQLDQDEQRVVAAGEAYLAAVKTINDRYEQHDKLLAEDAAIADRFGLGASDLARAPAPGVRKAVLAIYDKLRGLWLAERTDNYKPQVEQDESGLLQRRTYREIAGTPGYEIIMQAGLPAFPPLTARQEEIVAERTGNAALRAGHARDQAAALAAEVGRHPGRPS